jgi:hypothetical protein
LDETGCKLDKCLDFDVAPSMNIMKSLLIALMHKSRP